MSPTVAPLFLGLLNAAVHKGRVQRLPRSTGFLARMASSAKARTSMFIETAKLSMKLPQPDEHASLSMMCSITPSRTPQALHVLATRYRG